MKKATSILFSTSIFLLLALPVFAEEAVKPVEVKAKKSYEIMEPKPGVHSCSVTNMPANSPCAGTIKAGSWESKLTYRSMLMDKRYTGSTDIGNPMNNKMEMAMSMAMLAYGVTDNLLVGGMIPASVSKSMTMMSMTTSSSGLGDISLTAKWRIWSDGDLTTPPRAFDDLREKGNSVALFAGIKAPTGANDVKNNMGMRLPDTLQPGTGSWDYRIGLSYSKDLNPFWIHASAFQNFTGTNSFGYKFGDKTEYNLAFQFEPWINSVLNLELNGESVDSSAQNGTTVTDTGYSKLFVTPGLQYQFNDNWDLELGYAIPISVAVTGTQMVESNRWFIGFRGTIL